MVSRIRSVFICPIVKRRLKLTGILGTLSILPREIRDKIYELVSTFGPHEPRTLRTGLLRTSRVLHDESKQALFTFNEFHISINQVYEQDSEEDQDLNRRYEFGFCFARRHFESLTDTSGWVMDIDAKLPGSMLRLVKKWHLSIGDWFGIKNTDIQSANPEDTEYKSGISSGKSLLMAIEEALTVLKHCQQVHHLVVNITLIAAKPGRAKLLLSSIMTLRNIRSTEIMVEGRSWPNVWRLNLCYGRYMARIIALPDDAPIPKYACDHGKEEDGFGCETIFRTDSEI